MKVNTSNASPLGWAGTTEPWSGSEASNTGTPLSSADQIQLSSLSDSILTDRTGPAEHSARTAEVGQLVTSGGYQVKSDQVSADVIRHSMALAA